MLNIALVLMLQYKNQSNFTNITLCLNDHDNDEYLENGSRYI
jgi:hypothetical protein